MIVFLLCAGLLGLLATGLTINVGRLRAKKRVFLGDGGDPELVSAIRAQGNLIELTPLCLLLIYLLAGPYGHCVVAVLAVILVAARLLHAGGMLGFSRFGRAAGAISTTVVLAAASILLVLVGLGLEPF